MSSHRNITSHMPHWAFSTIRRIAGRATRCSKCDEALIYGNQFRYGVGKNGRYCVPNCTGFIASRYADVDVSNFTAEELKVRDYYDWLVVSFLAGRVQTCAQTPYFTGVDEAVR